MYKRLFSAFWIILITCFVALPSAAQTIKERSHKAYSRLSVSHGQETIDLLNELTTYRIIDSIDRAKILAQKAVYESLKLKTQSSLAKSLVLLSSVFILKEKFDSASYYLENAGEIYKTSSVVCFLDMYYLNEGKIKAKQNLNKEALAFFNKAVCVSEKNKNFYILGRTYLGIANCYKQLQNKSAYIDNLDKADQSFRKGNDPVQIGPTIIGLGIRFLDLGLYEKANEQFIRAVKMLEISADSLFLGYTYINLSGLYAPNVSEKSTEYYQKSLRIFRALKNDRGIAYALNQMGVGCLFNKEYSKALPLLLEAATLKVKAADWQGACFVYGNLTELYLKINQPVKAATTLKTAEEMVVKAGDKLSLASVTHTKGVYYSTIKEYDKALECFNKSLKVAKEINLQNLINESLLSISETYQSKGNAAEALKYYKLYTTSKDSVMNASNVMNIAELQLKYETEKKDNQIKELIRSKLKTDKGRYYIIGNIIAVILLVFVAIVFFFRLKGNYSERLQFLLTIREQVNHQREKALDLFSPLVPERQSKPLLTEQQQNNLWQDLQDLMANEKLFLHNDLSLAELARRLNTNTTYLSKVINDITQQNFSNYLNQYRIEEACKLLSQPQNHYLTIEGIAQMVGFKSKSAFNAAFKKIKSTTPSEFLIAQSNDIELLA
jgi:AraC-like DNA-binding protein